MVGTQHSFEDRYGAFVERLGFVVAPLFRVEECETEKTISTMSVFREVCFYDGIQACSLVGGT